MKKKIYRYMNHKLEKHELCTDCILQYEIEYNCGTLYRCLTHGFFGYGTLKSARLEEKQNIIKEIYELQELLKTFKD